MDDNQNITKAYKAEITEILSKISIGLSESITAKIDPKIQEISSGIKIQNDLAQIIKDENIKSSNKLNEIVKRVESSVEKNQQTILKLDKTINDKMLSEIRKISNVGKNITIETKILEIQSKQKYTQNLMYVIIALLAIVFSLGLIWFLKYNALK